MRKCGVFLHPMDGVSFVNWASDPWRGKIGRTLLCRLCLSVTIYYNWWERNATVFHNEYVDVITLQNTISKQETQARS